MGGAEATSYRSVTSCLNYMSPDRIDVQYATEEAARHTSKPCISHLKTKKKLGKYLAGRPRSVNHFEWQKNPSLVTGYTDSDWAGVPRPLEARVGESSA